MKTILIPTDFSDNARNAIKFAINNFNTDQTNYILFNAYSMPTHGRAGMLMSLIDELKKDSDEMLLEELNWIKNELNIDTHNFTTKNMHGGLADTVESYTKEHTVDCVIMGTQGASDITDMIIGSNAYNVVQEVKCPIILVPSGDFGLGFRQILFTADFNRVNPSVTLKPLIDLVNQFNANLHILNVVAEDEINEHSKYIERLSLQKAFKSLKHSFHTEINDNIEDGIMDYMKDNSCDLVVMISRDNGFFDFVFQTSTTRKIVLNSKIPVLVLHEED